MRRHVSRSLHLVFVGLIVCLLSLDSASACRLFAGRRPCCSCCVPATECPQCEPMSAPGGAGDAAAPPAVSPPALPEPRVEQVVPMPPAFVPAAEADPPQPAEPAAPLRPVQPQPVEPAAPMPPAAAPVEAAPPAPMPMPAPTRSQPAPAAPVVDPFAPAPAPAAPRPAAPPADDGDDPFAPARPAAVPGAAPASVTPDEDDPFAPIPARPASIPLAANLRLDREGRLPSRLWTDNSGQFHTQARLIVILAGKVRLLKATGRTTTVSLDRLSGADRQYVEAVIRQYGADLSHLPLVAAR